MKSILLLVLFSIMPTNSFAQNENDKKVFLDSIFRETKSDPKYYRIIKDYALEKEEYDIVDYYKSGKIMMKGKSLKKEYLYENGDFTYYFENGNKLMQKQFSKGLPVGKFTSWYENGNKKIEGEYVKIENMYRPILKIDQFWNAENVQTVENGTGFFEDLEESKITSLKGTLKNGLKEGEWTGNGFTLKFKFKEIYSEGKLVSGESTDADNNKNKYLKEFEMPSPKSGMDGFRNYIAKNYHMPKIKVDVNGSIILSFIVEKNGDITEIKVVRSLGENFDNEAIRVLKSYKDWTPGKSRGINIRTAFTIPISIKTKA